MSKISQKHKKSCRAIELENPWKPETVEVKTIGGDVYLTVKCKDECPAYAVFKASDILNLLPNGVEK